MKKQIKPPKFNSENKERDYWAKIDLTKYYRPADFRRASFPNLKPTSRSVSIRIPTYLLNRIKEEANSLNVPYQSLIKEYIRRGVLSTK